jgi:hypothetical protein
MKHMHFTLEWNMQRLFREGKQSKRKNRKLWRCFHYHPLGLYFTPLCIQLAEMIEVDNYGAMHARDIGTCSV